MTVGAKILAGILVLIPTVYLGACGFVAHRRAQAFVQVKVGDPEQHVIHVLGKPVDRETSDDPRLSQYGVAPCRAPCAQRLWYPNSLSLAGEAWSVSLDRTGHVVATAHIVSP